MYKEVHFGKRRYLYYGYDFKRVAIGFELAFKARQVGLDLVFFWVNFEW